MWSATHEQNDTPWPRHDPAQQLATPAYLRPNHTSISVKRSSAEMSCPIFDGRSRLPHTGKNYRRNTTGHYQTWRTSTGTSFKWLSNRYNRRINDKSYCSLTKSSHFAHRKPTRTTAHPYAHHVNVNRKVHNTSSHADTQTETSYLQP